MKILICDIGAPLRIKLSVFLMFIVLTISFACNSGPERHGEPGREVIENTGKSAVADYNEQKAAAVLESSIKEFQWQQLPEIARTDTIRQLVAQLYNERGYAPAWNTNTVSEHTEDFLIRLTRLEREGLDTADFRLNSLQQEVSGLFRSNDPLDYERLAALEVRLSASYLALARQIGKGRIEPAEYADDWHIHPEEVDKLNSIKTVFSRGLDEALASIEPDYRQYSLLKEALKNYLTIARKGGWEELAIDKPLSLGDSSENIPAIRQRLALETELNNTDSPHYDEALEEALAAYRYRYNVDSDAGTITEELIAALNVLVEERIRVINLNLERCRWLSSPMGDRYLIVNLPEYRLRAVEEGDPVMDMKVIVGKSVNATPIFSDSIEYVEFAPYWNVPASISHEEILPHAMEDPSYLQERHYELVDGWGEKAPVIPVDKVDWEEVTIDDFPYRVRQKPGPWNSLGHVKFIFPNSKAIYLHDTPQDHLFNASEREFSHGCIRVEKPDKLADYLLPQLNERQVNQYLQLDDRKVVPLEEKLPVYLVYFTTVVDNKGELRFLDDIYGLDKVQKNALEEG